MEIIITEEQAKRLAGQSIGKCDVLDKVNDNVLSNSPFLPSDSIIDFKKNVIRNRYYQILSALSKYEDLQSIKSLDTAKTALSQLTNNAKKIEEPLQEQLETVCKTVMSEIFNQGEENVNFTPTLVGKVQPANGFRVEPQDGEEIEYQDMSEVGEIGREIEKRRIINAIIEGGAHEIFANCDSWISMVHRLNNELPILYTKILLLRDLVLFLDDSKIDSKNVESTGIAEVIFNGEGNKPDIDVQAILFPYLLEQSIKGFLELFASNGLPDDKNQAMYVLAQTECLNSERWYQRFGVPMWQLLFDGLTLDTNNVPHYIMNLSMQPSSELEGTLQEIFAHTKAGMVAAKELFDKAVHDSDYSAFEDSIIKRNHDYECAEELSIEDIDRLSI